MKKQTTINALMQNLSIHRIKKLNREELKEIIFKLREDYKYTYSQLSNITGISESTIKNWATAPKQDSTQNTHSLLKSGLDIDVLIRHFQCYIPRGREEKEDIKKLIMVLTQCLRK